MILKFKQAYNWGEGWEGKLANIPECAVFHNINKSSDTREDWMIIFPSEKLDLEDAEERYLDTGCIQVAVYSIMEFTFIYLRNIKPIGEEWVACDEYEFEEKIGSYLKTIYRYTYALPKLQGPIVNEDGSINLELINKAKPILLIAERLKGIDSEGRFITTAVHVKERISHADNFGIYDGACNLYQFEELDSKFKVKISHDSTLFDKTLREVVEYFKK